MNVSDLLDTFYARVAELPAMQTNCKTQHLALYTWICKLHERTGRAVMDLPRDYTMTMSFIGSPNTFKDALEELQAWGLVEIVQRASNQWQTTKVKFACTESYQQDTSKIQPTTPAGSQATIPATTPAVNTNVCDSNTVSITGNTGTTVKPDIPVHTTTPNPKPIPANPKTAYRERVLLTAIEHDTLVTKHGIDVTNAMLDKLDAYKLANGKKYESDYGAINQWVITAVKEDARRVQGNRPAAATPVDRKPPNNNATTYSDMLKASNATGAAVNGKARAKTETETILPF